MGVEPREEQGEAWSGWAEVEALEEPRRAWEAGCGELRGQRGRPEGEGRGGSAQRVG